jgi:superfamily I DNA/RNA helicase
MARLFEMSPLPSEGTELRLNASQRHAITHGDGPLLVIAGAGTGKTRVITERIRHLLDSDTSRWEKHSWVTFTKKLLGK